MRKIYSGYCPNDRGRAFTEKIETKEKSKAKLKMLMEAINHELQTKSSTWHR